MAENINESQPPTETRQPFSNRHLTRRQFLKKGLELAGVGALYLGAKFFWKIYEPMFADMASQIRCLPSIGSTSENSRFRNIQAETLKDSYDEALLVVHPGFGLLRSPGRYEKKEKYLNYLTKLKGIIEESRKNEDLVVFLVGAQEVRRGRAAEGLSFTDADFAVITQSANPLPIACVETPGGKFFWQNSAALPDILKEKGVKKVKIAGEFKNACVAQAENLITGGFKTELLEDAIY